MTLPLSYPAFAVWGAGTDIGKTMVCAGLAHVAHDNLSYIKPVQTGYPQDSDARTVAAAAGGAATAGSHAAQLDAAAAAELLHSNSRFHTLYAWRDPVSPHQAVQLEGRPVPDADLVESVAAQLNAHSPAFCLVETAGGVASPAPSGRLQCDALRPLRLPSLLVGDGRLGGITTTVCAYEALLSRGYPVPFIVVPSPGGDTANADLLAAHLAEEAVEVVALPGWEPAPPGAPTAAATGDVDAGLREWLTRASAPLHTLAHSMRAWHEARLTALRRAASNTVSTVWWPFTQHTSLTDGDVTVIDSRNGEAFSVFQDAAATGPCLVDQYDAAASWWTQGLPPAAAPLASRAMSGALGRYGHVMFPENTHAPALELAGRLLEVVRAPPGSRVFFSDDGSTAVEVALKMAFKLYDTRHPPSGNDGSTAYQVLGVGNSYHGDTTGVMCAVEDSDFTTGQSPWVDSKGLFLAPPTVGLSCGVWKVTLPEPLRTFHLHRLDTQFDSRDAVFSPDRDSDGRLADIYRQWIVDSMERHEDAGGFGRRIKLAACLLEPVLQAAGGMVLVDPLFQRVMVQVCVERRIPVILDEVFSGLWRLGSPTAARLLHIQPDIACYAKLLTGGLMTLACTVATGETFDAFKGSTKSQALLHGHSYTGSPIGCAAAITALDTLGSPGRNPNVGEGGMLRDIWDAGLVDGLSHHEAVEHVVALGTVLSVTLKVDAGSGGYNSSRSKEVVQRLRPLGIYSRPLGNVVYLMCGPGTSQSTAAGLLHKLIQHL